MARTASSNTRTADRPRHEPSRQEVQQFLDRFAKALTTGDIATVVSLWEAPAFVLDDSGVKVVSEKREIEQFFAGAKDLYNSQGITDTHAEISDLRWPTDRIAIAEVRWPYLDAQGHQVGEETSTYTLRRDDRDELRLRATVMHGAKTIGKPRH
ncbi:MAG TPA: hypothetical protein VF169_13070 [Albitalea sp.]|uniref:hypothetical protein n=1 Tax=Piscinibacter sp. TaxID=1903157 RepID=UPI002ED3B8E8